MMMTTTMIVVGMTDSEAVDECFLRDSSNTELRHLKPGLLIVVAFSHFDDNSTFVQCHYAVASEALAEQVS